MSAAVPQPDRPATSRPTTGRPTSGRPKTVPMTTTGQQTARPGAAQAPAAPPHAAPPPVAQPEASGSATGRPTTSRPTTSRPTSSRLATARPHVHRPAASAQPALDAVSAALCARPSAPPLRLLPAPPSGPPYDDEPPARPALQLVGGSRTDRPAPRRPGTHDAPGARHPPVAPSRVRTPSLTALPAPQPAGAADVDGVARGVALPASRPFAYALVQRLLEVCAGARPVSQLRHDTTPDLYDEIERLLAARPRATALRPTRRDVRSVHVQERPEGVAEVCATVLRAGRAGALALRLEGRRGTWKCTELLGL